MTPLPPLPAMAIEMLVAAPRDGVVLRASLCDVSFGFGFKVDSLAWGSIVRRASGGSGLMQINAPETALRQHPEPDNSISVPQYKNKRRQQPGQPRKRGAMRGATDGQGTAQEAAKQ